MRELVLVAALAAVAAPAAAQVTSIEQYEETMKICRRVNDVFDRDGATAATQMLSKWLEQVKPPYKLDFGTAASVCLAYTAGVGDARKGVVTTRIGQ